MTRLVSDIIDKGREGLRSSLYQYAHIEVQSARRSLYQLSKIAIENCQNKGMSGMEGRNA